jgi:gas vesicle protein
MPGDNYKEYKEALQTVLAANNSTIVRILGTASNKVRKMEEIVRRKKDTIDGLKKEVNTTNIQRQISQLESEINTCIDKRKELIEAIALLKQ